MFLPLYVRLVTPFSSALTAPKAVRGGIQLIEKLWSFSNGSLVIKAAGWDNAIWHHDVVCPQAGQASGRCVPSELRAGRTVGLSKRRGRSAVRHVAPVHPSPDETHVRQAPEEQPGEECRSVTKQRWAGLCMCVCLLLVFMSKSLYKS